MRKIEINRRMTEGRDTLLRKWSAYVHQNSCEFYSTLEQFFGHAWVRGAANGRVKWYAGNEWKFSSHTQCIKIFTKK